MILDLFATKIALDVNKYILGTEQHFILQLPWLPLHQPHVQSPIPGPGVLSTLNIFSSLTIEGKIQAAAAGNTEIWFLHTIMSPISIGLHCLFT